VLAGCPPDGLILDPFVGSGTTCVVAQKLGRRAIGVDLNRDYLELARRRIEAVPLPLI
jgi:site-specific DNA-methyltransferase (cytosine-N4-specific)